MHVLPHHAAGAGGGAAGHRRRAGGLLAAGLCVGMNQGTTVDQRTDTCGLGFEWMDGATQHTQAELAELDDKMADEVLQVSEAGRHSPIIYEYMHCGYNHETLYHDRKQNHVHVFYTRTHTPPPPPQKGDPQVLQAEEARVRQAAGGPGAGPRVLVPRGALSGGCGLYFVFVFVFV